jgi:hypothetical protein
VALDLSAVASWGGITISKGMLEKCPVQFIVTLAVKRPVVTDWNILKDRF